MTSAPINEYLPILITDHCDCCWLGSSMGNGMVTLGAKVKLPIVGLLVGLLDSTKVVVVVMEVKSLEDAVGELRVKFFAEEPVGVAMFLLIMLAVEALV